MATMQPALVAPSSGEETHLAADGGTESIAVPLARSRTISRATAIDRRQERRWIRAAQSGSEEALEQLYRRHWPWAHRAAYLVVHDAAAAEDIAQEAFLAAVRALDRFDRRRPFGPVAEPDRGQPGDRLGSRPGAAPRGRGRAELDVGAGSHGERREAERTGPTRRTSSPPSPRSRPSIGRSWCCATCSSTRRARSPKRSSFPAERSTRGCAGRWTGCRCSWKGGVVNERRLIELLRETSGPGGARGPGAWLEGRARGVRGATPRSGQAAPEPAGDRAGGWPADRRRRAEPGRREGRRHGPRRRSARRRERPAGAHLAARAGAPAGHLPEGPLDRPPGRLEATARRLRRARPGRRTACSPPSLAAAS